MYSDAAHMLVIISHHKKKATRVKLNDEQNQKDQREQSPKRNGMAKARRPNNKALTNKKIETCNKLIKRL